MSRRIKLIGASSREYVFIEKCIVATIRVFGRHVLCHIFSTVVYVTLWAMPFGQCERFFYTS